MNGKRAAVLLIAVAALSLGRGTGVHARAGRQGAAGQLSEHERARLLAKGKEIFVEKCAKCHNEAGDKALRAGKPLNERGLSTEAITRAVSGRLKDRTDEERRAVTQYIASLMKDKGAEKR